MNARKRITAAIELGASSPSKRVGPHDMLETRLFTHFIHPWPKRAISQCLGRKHCGIGYYIGMEKIGEN